MSEKTPGQAAYEAYLNAHWDDEARVWEEVAQAVLNDAFPGLKRERDQARAETRQMQDAVHADLGQLLEVLGLGDYARPESPHEVFGQCVAKVRELLAERDRLRGQLAEAVNPTAADYDHAAEIMRLRDEATQLRYERDQLIGVNENLRAQLATAGPVAVVASRDSVAPELAAAMAETRKVADAANVVFDLFTRGSDGWRARISGVNLMRAYKAIGRPVPAYLSHLEGQ